MAGSIGSGMQLRGERKARRLDESPGLSFQILLDPLPDSESGQEDGSASRVRQVTYRAGEHAHLGGVGRAARVLVQLGG
ncbi:hypothetical protein BH23GEM8_BH23GEM8_02470 [soil metagenome]